MTKISSSANNILVGMLEPNRSQEIPTTFRTDRKSEISSKLSQNTTIDKDAKSEENPLDVVAKTANCIRERTTLDSKQRFTVNERLAARRPSSEDLESETGAVEGGKDRPLDVVAKTANRIRGRTTLDSKQRFTVNECLAARRPSSDNFQKQCEKAQEPTNPAKKDVDLREKTRPSFIENDEAFLSMTIPAQRLVNEMNTVMVMTCPNELQRLLICNGYSTASSSIQTYASDKGPTKYFHPIDETLTVMVQQLDCQRSMIDAAIAEGARRVQLQITIAHLRSLTVTNEISLSNAERCQWIFDEYSTRDEGPIEFQAEYPHRRLPVTFIAKLDKITNAYRIFEQATAINRLRFDNPIMVLTNPIEGSKFTCPSYRDAVIDAPSIVAFSPSKDKISTTGSKGYYIVRGKNTVRRLCLERPYATATRLVGPTSIQCIHAVEKNSRYLRAERDGETPKLGKPSTNNLNEFEIYLFNLLRRKHEDKGKENSELKSFFQPSPKLDVCEPTSRGPNFPLLALLPTQSMEKFFREFFPIKTDSDRGLIEINDMDTLKRFDNCAKRQGYRGDLLNPSWFDADGFESPKGHHDILKDVTLEDFGANGQSTTLDQFEKMGLALRRTENAIRHNELVRGFRNQRLSQLRSNEVVKRSGINYVERYKLVRAVNELKETLQHLRTLIDAIMRKNIRSNAISATYRSKLDRIHAILSNLIDELLLVESDVTQALAKEIDRSVVNYSDNVREKLRNLENDIKKMFDQGFTLTTERAYRSRQKQEVRQRLRDSTCTETNANHISIQKRAIELKNLASDFLRFSAGIHCPHLGSEWIFFVQESTVDDGSGIQSVPVQLRVPEVQSPHECWIKSCTEKTKLANRLKNALIGFGLVTEANSIPKDARMDSALEAANLLAKIECYCNSLLECDIQSPALKRAVAESKTHETKTIVRHSDFARANLLLNTLGLATDGKPLSASYKKIRDVVLGSISIEKIKSGLANCANSGLAPHVISEKTKIENLSNVEANDMWREMVSAIVDTTLEQSILDVAVDEIDLELDFTRPVPLGVFKRRFKKPLLSSECQEEIDSYRNNLMILTISKLAQAAKRVERRSSLNCNKLNFKLFEQVAVQFDECGNEKRYSEWPRSARRNLKHNRRLSSFQYYVRHDLKRLYDRVVKPPDVDARVRGFVQPIPGVLANSFGLTHSTSAATEANVIRRAVQVGAIPVSTARINHRVHEKIAQAGTRNRRIRRVLTRDRCQKLEFKYENIQGPVERYRCQILKFLSDRLSDKADSQLKEEVEKILTPIEDLVRNVGAVTALQSIGRSLAASVKRNSAMSAAQQQVLDEAERAFSDTAVGMIANHAIPGIIGTLSSLISLRKIAFEMHSVYKSAEYRRSEMQGFVTASSRVERLNDAIENAHYAARKTLNMKRQTYQATTAIFDFGINIATRVGLITSMLTPGATPVAFLVAALGANICSSGHSAFKAGIDARRQHSKDQIRQSLANFLLGSMSHKQERLLEQKHGIKSNREVINAVIQREPNLIYDQLLVQLRSEVRMLTVDEVRVRIESHVKHKEFVGVTDKSNQKDAQLKEMKLKLFELSDRWLCSPTAAYLLGLGVPPQALEAIVDSKRTKEMDEYCLELIETHLCKRIKRTNI